jgi:hypothetical protein
MTTKRDIQLVKTTGKVAKLGHHPSQSSTSGNSPDLATLARLVSAYAPYDGSFEMRIPGLHAGRMSRANTQCFHTLRLPSLCIAAQGAKTVIVGQDTYEYDASRMIVFSVALPITSQISQATPSEPYLS